MATAVATPSAPPRQAPEEPAAPQQQPPQQQLQQLQQLQQEGLGLPWRQEHQPMFHTLLRRSQNVARRFAWLVSRHMNPRSNELLVRHVDPAILGINVGQGGGDAVSATLLQDGTEITMGIPIENNALYKVIRRVILLASALATFYVCYFIFMLLRSCSLAQVRDHGRCQSSAYASSNSDDPTSLWAAVSSLLIELSIPACGYFGALYSNRQMTCCFCSCNLFIAILSAMTMIRTSIRISDIDGQCEREQNAQNRRTCEIWSSNGMDKYIMIFHSITVICMGCLAFWFGNILYNRLAQDFSFAPAPVVGEVISISELRGMIDLPNGATFEQEGAGDADAESEAPAAEIRPQG